MKPDERIAAIAEIQEPLSVDLLARTALIASGTAEASLEGFMARIQMIVSAVPPAEGNIPQDAENLLEWMHESLLKRYVESQTRLDILLDKGSYNCVSSAVLYLILARSQGIPVYGVLTTDHAFCMIRDGEIYTDVETTTPFGFDPGSRREAVDAFTGQTGFSYVPPGNYTQRRTIGEKELISLIYQNRISALQRRGQWSKTVGLAKDRWILAGTEAAAQDFRSAVTNYAADRDRAGKGEEGILFLNEAAGILGDSEGLSESARALFGNALVRYLRSGNMDAAASLFGNEQLQLLLSTSFIQGRYKEFRNRQLENAIRVSDFDESLSMINDALNTSIIDEGRWAEFSLFLWSGEARRRAKSGNWEIALDFLETADARTRSIPRWGELLDNYIDNTVAGYHNRFAAAIQRGKFQEADSILNQGLGRFPENRILLRDAEILSNRR